MTPAATLRVLRGAAWSAHPALAVVAAFGCLAACAPPARTATGAGATIFVASSLEGTVQRLDPATGRARGAPLPVPGRPRQLAPGPAGGVLVLSLDPGRGCHLTHLVPPGNPGQGWAAHPLLSRSAPEACAHALLAGDGTRYAVVATPAAPAAPETTSGRSAPTPACRLQIFDLAGRPAAAPSTHEVGPCPPDAALTAVAASAGPAGPLVHVGLWRGQRPGRPTGQGVVLALDPATGAELGRTELGGAPERLVAAAAPDAARGRLYVVEGTPGPDERNPGILDAPPTRWRLLALEPVALTAIAAQPLAAAGDDAPPPAAATPDGARVLVLLRAAAHRTALVPLDAATGTAGPAVFLPGEALSGLVVTAERVYVPDALGHGVWVVDHRRGRRLETVPAGRGPLAIISSPPP